MPIPRDTGRSSTPGSTGSSAWSCATPTRRSPSCRELVAGEGVQSILLCPGNSHQDVAAIAAALGDGISVSVARGDARSMRVAAKAMEQAGWFAAAPA